MRGWVYVVTNKAMPGLVKVGYSTKDPVIRAKDFDSAALPYSYIVDYDALVNSPHSVEQAAHKELKSRGLHEQKEWFKCTVPLAVGVIRAVAENQGGIITERASEGTSAQVEQPVRPTVEQPVGATEKAFVRNEKPKSVMRFSPGSWISNDEFPSRDSGRAQSWSFSVMKNRPR